MRLIAVLACLAQAVSSALLSDKYRIESPCKPAVAAMLVAATSTNPVPTADGPNIYWVGAMPATQAEAPTVSLDPTAIQVTSPFASKPMPSNLVGAPAAIGRLDLEKRRIDHLRCELPCLLYTSPSPRDRQKSRMPSSA